MKEFFFSFRSVTEAQQARQQLKRRGIPCRLERVPRTLQQGGCGYGVRVAERDFGRARSVLRGYQAVFTFAPEGRAVPL